MKKIIALALSLVFCLGALVGCGGLDEEEKGANIRMYITDYPYTLDPAVVQLNSDVDQILSLIFEPLAVIDEDGKVEVEIIHTYLGKSTTNTTNHHKNCS